MLVHTLAGIAWDPQLRGYLTFAVGVLVLMGSVYLLLATNVGARLGFLLAAAALFGWLTIMGGVWWVYGSIGMLGDVPTWKVTEVRYPTLDDAALESARDLDTSEMPSHDELVELTGDAYTEVRDAVEPTLDGWRILQESNPSFGEAKAAVDAYFLEHPDAELEVKTAADYVTVYSFERGGKARLPENPSRWDRLYRKFKTTFLQPTSPAHYAIIQVQPVVKQEAEPGQPPPTPRADPNQPVVSVIMERDLGDKRLPGAMLTVFSGIMFAVLCMQLHRRDERVAAARALVPATPRS
jgi:hypothetical protein